LIIYLHNFVEHINISCTWKQNWRCIYSSQITQPWRWRVLIWRKTGNLSQIF